MMNTYLVALIGLLAIFIVGFIVYGLLLKSTLKGHEVQLTLPRFVVAAIGMYIVALAFSVLYQDVSFASGVTGAVKGLYLGLLVGIAFFAIPLFADASYFKAKESVLWSVIFNWVAAFVVLGLVVGGLLG